MEITERKYFLSKTHAYALSGDSKWYTFAKRTLAKGVNAAENKLSAYKEERGETLICQKIGGKWAFHKLDAELNVILPSRGYLVIGGGSAWVEGKLYGTSKSEILIRDALVAAAEHCSVVRAPFHINYLEDDR